MKRLNILILVVFACGYIYGAEKTSGIPTEEQVQKLAAAAWKEPIKSIDVTYFKDYMLAPEPIEQLRKRAEKSADREFKGRSLDELKPYEIERRNKTIERNFENWVEDQKYPRKAKCRVWISDDEQRIDMVKVRSNEPLGPDMPFVDTFINTKDANTGDFVSYHYAGDINAVFVCTTMWTKETIAQFVGVPILIARPLRFFLGINQGGTPKSLNYIPDPNKMAELARTGLTTIEVGKSMRGAKRNKVVNRIGIRPDPNAPDTRDIIKMGDPNHFSTAVLICDRKDYSRVYRIEGRSSTTNKIMYIRECNDFDSKGFPHNVTEIKYDKDGNLKEKSVYRIEKVELNPVIPNEVFKLNPLEGYKVIDSRSKKP